MASDIIQRVAIKGVAAAVPKEIKTAEDYTEHIGEKAVRKFVDTVGIRERHVGDGRIMTSDLCCAAAEHLMKQHSIDRAEIDAIIVVTQTGDYLAPAAACILQHRLGLSSECLAYDLSMGCSGYIYGLYNAASHVQNGWIRRALLLVGDSLSYMVSPEDHGQMMLAGDAGTATLLEYEGNAGNMNFLFQTRGEGYRSLIVPYGGYKHRYGNQQQQLRADGIIRSDYDTFMDGAEVFKFSVGEVPKLFQQFFQCYDYDPTKCDYVILHQANLFIMQNIARRLGIPWDKVPVSLDRYGNTSSATIPLTLCDYFGSHRQEAGEKELLMSGFGVGMSMGIASVKLEPQVCLPVIETDLTFEDHIEQLHHVGGK